MLPSVPVKYLYVPNACSSQEQAVIIRAFESAGYNLSDVRVAHSVWEACHPLPPGSTIMIYTIELFDSLADLLELLERLQYKRVLLQSLCEPWVNESVRDHAYCVEKLRVTMNSCIASDHKY